MQATGNDRMVAAAAAAFPERIVPMAEDEKGTSGVVPRLVQEFIGQLRAITESERLEDLAGSTARATVGGSTSVRRNQTRVGCGYPRTALLRSTWKSGPAPAVTAGSRPAVWGSSCSA